MNLRNRTLGPWGFRDFTRWFEGPFQRVFVVAWFGLIGVFLLTSISGLDKRLGVDLRSISRFAVLPLIIVVTGLMGTGILWQLVLLRRRLAQATPLQRLLSVAWLLAGLMFVAGAVSLTFVLFRGRPG
jgi:hypothetical protein